MNQKTNEEYMQEALLLAKKALSKDEVPVGAVLVRKGKIIAKAYNKREKSRDATAHAEILCIRKACKKLKDFRLNDCEIFVTLEPCAMCMGAILNARVGKLIYGASINKEEVLSAKEIAERANLNHNCIIEGGVLAEECGALVSGYFKSKRKNK